MFGGILIVLSAINAINCGIFDLSPAFFSEKPICQEINSTLYSHIDKILANINETAEVLTRSKRSLVERNYNFKILSRSGKDINISSKYLIESTSNWTTILKDEPIYNLIPLNYSLEVTSIENLNESVILISGIRCKWECNRETKICQGPHCWNNPSLCFGDIDTCIENDGDGSCFIASGPNYQNRNMNESVYSFTNLDLGRYIFKDFGFSRLDNHIYLDGGVMSTYPQSFHWNCTTTETNVFDNTENVTCYNDYSWAAPSLGLLKTLAG